MLFLGNIFCMYIECMIAGKSVFEEVVCNGKLNSKK